MSFKSTRRITNSFINILEVEPLGENSDQLLVKMEYPNKKIAQDYINTLLTEFDSDGVKDRQLEYKNTIEFVDKRSRILRSELEVIEKSKQNFKRSNNLSDIASDARVNVQEQVNYSNEIFKAESQKTLASYLLTSLNETSYDYLPLNIGFENFDINQIINQYNQSISERDRFLASAGRSNYLVKSIEGQIDNYRNNISNSLNNFLASIDITIKELTAKENEFLTFYKGIPENEKILRSIERELNVKEALFYFYYKKKKKLP